MDENVKALLQTCGEMTKHVKASAESISSMFRTYREYEAYNELNSLFSNLGDLINGISASGISCIDITQLIEQMQQIKEAISNTDVILLSDILEYELVELLDDWYDKISKSIEENC